MKKKIIWVNKENSKRKFKNESGAVLITVTLAMFVLIGLMALVLDVGVAYLSTGELQKVCDAAVISAGRLLPVKQDDTVAINAIKDSAIYYAEHNGYSNLTRSNVVLGNLSHGEYTNITVTASESVKMNFARALGINSLQISRSAKAKLSPMVKMTGVAPMGVLKSELESRIASGDTSHVVLKYGNGSGQQGFFGVFDLDGSNGGGASDYRRWLAQGYPGETSIGDIMLVEHGNMVGPTYQGFTARYDACTHFNAQTGGPGCTISNFVPTCPRIITVVVYYIDYFQNARIAGFASFLLEAQSSGGEITGSFLGKLSKGVASGDSAGISSDYGVYSLLISE